MMYSVKLRICTILALLFETSIHLGGFVHTTLLHTCIPIHQGNVHPELEIVLLYLKSDDKLQVWPWQMSVCHLLKGLVFINMDFSVLVKTII